MYKQIVRVNFTQGTICDVTVFFVFFFWRVTSASGKVMVVKSRISLLLPFINQLKYIMPRKTITSDEWRADLDK